MLETILRTHMQATILRMMIIVLVIMILMIILHNIRKNRRNSRMPILSKQHIFFQNIKKIKKFSTNRLILRTVGPWNSLIAGIFVRIIIQTASSTALRSILIENLFALINQLSFELLFFFCLYNHVLLWLNSLLQCEMKYKTHVFKTFWPSICL